MKTVASSIDTGTHVHVYISIKGFTCSKFKCIYWLTLKCKVASLETYSASPSKEKES